MEEEYIVENGKVLECMLNNFFTEAKMNKGSGSRVALRNMVMQCVNDLKSNPQAAQRCNASIEGRRRNLAIGALNNEKAASQILGEYIKKYVESECVSEGVRLGKGGRKNLQKEINNAVAKLFRNTNLRIDMVRKAQQATGTAPTNSKEDYTPEERSKYLKEGYIECDNIFYKDGLYLSEGDYQSNAKKTAKGTILTILVFIISLLLTNMVRSYFGGTPGGDFASEAMKNGFTWFTCLILAPIIEEPAKLISVKGGYGKHFFFAFNFLEFGLYVMMLVSGGMSVGVAILIRTVAVMMHALTMRVLGSTKGKGIAMTSFKLAVSILIHFIFNALFLKYMVFGIAGNTILLFIIGFFGVAFGLFLVSKIFSSKTKNDNDYNDFTTQSNLDYGMRGGYGYA